MPAVKILGIIPARGGSKGIPGKNIIRIANKPLIAYTIDAAIKSQFITEFVVSTDDEDIAVVAKNAGSSVLTRPRKLAMDHSPMIEVVLHALEEMEKTRKCRYEYVVVLQPTTPLRKSQDIDTSLRLLMESKADSVVSVYQVADHHPGRMYHLKAGKLIPYDAKLTEIRRQDLPPVYHRNGAIYAATRNLVTKQKTLLGKDCRAYVMPRERSVNIDEPIDLDLAELILIRKPAGKRA